METTTYQTFAGANRKARRRAAWRMMDDGSTRVRNYQEPAPVAPRMPRPVSPRTPGKIVRTVVATNPITTYCRECQTSGRCHAAEHGATYPRPMIQTHDMEPSHEIIRDTTRYPKKGEKPSREFNERYPRKLMI
jgi:hypothetical protein